MNHLALFIALALLAGGLCATAAESKVRIEKDVDYLGSSRKEKADLYLPATIPQGRRCPGVVIIHGGGWSGGDKGAAGALVEAKAVPALRRAVATAYPHSRPELADKFAVHECRIVEGVQAGPFRV